MPVTLTLATTDGQPTQQLTLPTSWAEVTLGQYLAAHTAGSAHAPALRLSGLADTVLDSLPVEQAADLAHHLGFASDEAALEALLPTPGLLEIGQSASALYYLAAERLATLPGAHPLAHGASLYAVYRAPSGTRVTPAEAEAAHAAVLAQPVTQVYADCLYFLASYHRVGTGAPAVGVRQPGTLSIQREEPAAPAIGLLARLAQRLRQASAPRRAPQAGIIS